jgi:hypothetical protein
MVVLKGTGISIACGILGPDWKGNAQFQLQILTREKQTMKQHEALVGTPCKRWVHCKAHTRC